MKNVKLWSKWRYILCFMGAHDWTCKAMEGIPPDPIPKGESIPDTMLRFKEYAKMYCKTCGKESKLNDRFKL